MFVLYGSQQRERILTQMCPKTKGVLRVTTSEINANENSSHSIHQYQWFTFHTPVPMVLKWWIVDGK
jgi:hypothetical protein